MSRFFNIVLPKANIKNAYWNPKDAVLVGKALEMANHERVRKFYRDLHQTCAYWYELDYKPRIKPDQDKDEEGKPTFHDEVNKRLWEAGFRIDVDVTKESKLCKCGNYGCNLDLDLLPHGTARMWYKYLQGDDEAFLTKGLDRRIRRAQEELDEENPFGIVLRPPRVPAGPPTAPGILKQEDTSDEESSKKREREEDDEPVTQPPMKVIRIPFAEEGMVFRVDPYGIGISAVENFMNGTFTLSRLDADKEWQVIKEPHEIEEISEAIEKKLQEAIADKQEREFHDAVADDN